MCISIHHVLVYSSDCRRTIQMLHGRISWLDSANNRLTRKLKEKKGLEIKLRVLSLDCICCLLSNCLRSSECARMRLSFWTVISILVVLMKDISNFVVEANPGKHLKYLNFEELCHTCVCNNGLVACTDNICNIYLFKFVYLFIYCNCFV